MVIAVELVVAALLAGAGLAFSVWLNSPRRTRPAFTRHLFDDTGRYYWDGRAWQPVASRYERSTPRLPARLEMTANRPGTSHGDKASVQH